MNLRSRSGLIILAAVACVTMSGCITHRENGSAHVWHYSLWVPLLTLGAGLACGPIGLLLRENRFGWLLMIACPVLTLVFGPGYFLDRVDLDADHFYLRTGIWFAPTVHDIKFADQQSAILTKVESRGRRGRKKTDFYLVFVDQANQEQKVPIGTLMDEALVEVLKNAIDKGVRVQNLVD